MSRVVDLTEWNLVGAELAELDHDKYLDCLERLRRIVEAQRVINEYETPIGTALPRHRVPGGVAS